MADPLYVFKKGTDPFDAIVIMDATQDEKRTAKYTPKKHPLETGANANRYIKKEPLAYSFSAVVTSTPLEGGEDLDRVRKIVDELTRLADNREEVTVVFKFRVFDAFVTNVDESVSVSDGNCMRLSVSFEEFTRTTPKATQIPPSRLKPKPRRRKSSKKGGKETGKDASPKTKKRGKTLFATGYDFAKTALGR